MGYNIGMIFVIISIIIYFYSTLFELPWKKLTGSGIIWFAIGIFIFYATSFPVLTFLNEMLEIDPRLAHEAFKLVKLGNVIQSLCFLMVVLCPLMPNS